MKAAVVGRLGWGVADQAISSITNFGLGIAVARSTSSAEFGGFSLAFATYTLILGCSRGLSTTPLMVRYGTVEESDWRKATKAATGTALLAGIVFGTMCLISSTVMQNPLKSVFQALGLLMPGLMLQDAWRYVFIGRGNASQACINDLVWGLLMVPPIFLLLGSGEASAAEALLIWGASAAIAALLGMLQARIVPRPDYSRDWILQNKDLGPAYVGDYLVGIGSSQIATYGIGLVGGLVIVGSIRGGQLLYGPLNLLLISVGLVVVPEGARLVAHGQLGDLWRMAKMLSLGLAIVPILWIAMLQLLPDRWGVELLGESWDSSRELLIPLGLLSASSGASLAAIAGIRALGAAGRGLRARLWAAPWLPVLAIAGTVAWAGPGAASCMAAAGWATVAIWWFHFRKALDAYSPANLE